MDEEQKKLIEAIKYLTKTMQGATGSLVHIQVKLMGTLSSEDIKIKMLESHNEFNTLLVHFLQFQNNYCEMSREMEHSIEMPKAYTDIMALMIKDGHEFTSY